MIINRANFLVFAFCILIYPNESSAKTSIPDDNNEIKDIELTKEPTLLSTHMCTYPLNLLKKGIEGYVNLDIHIDEKGDVHNVEFV